MANNRAFLTHDIENSLEDGEGKIAGKIYERTIEISSAEIKTLRASPKVLVPAPGSGRLIEFISAVLRVDSTDTVYTESTDNLVIEYSSGTDLTGAIETTGFIDQSTNEIRRVVTTWTTGDLEVQINKAVQLFNTGDGEYAAGTGVMTVTTLYRLHDFN
jgi:hypothetical protein